jgi:hypothetical protein
MVGFDNRQRRQHASPELLLWARQPHARHRFVEAFARRGDEIHIEGFDADDPLANPVIDTFEFANTTLTLTQLLAQGFDLNGTPDSDVIEGRRSRTRSMLSKATIRSSPSRVTIPWT